MERDVVALPAIESSGHSTFLRAFVLDCAALSIPSPSRPGNEDRYVFAPPGLPAAESAAVGYLFLVADGVSSGGKGAIAAQATVDVVRTVLLEKRASVLRPSLLELKLFEANDTVASGGRGRCTATGLWIWEETGTELHAGWAHVGDSRLYHRSGEAWKAITADHARGPYLTRAIGDGHGLVVDHGRVRLERGDWLVVASDGVWKGACPVKLRLGDGLETAADLARLLVSTARSNGSQDDATAIVVHIVEAPDDTAGRFVGAGAASSEIGEKTG